MTVATQIEILDLRHFSARQLRPLLEREAQVWKSRLRWDYRSSTELLLDYLDSRELPGLVALDRSRLIGFTFCVYESHKAVIGDVFVDSEDSAASLAVANTLLEHLLQMLQHSPNIHRIESQLLLYDAGAINGVFTAAGFEMFPRRFLELDFSSKGSLWMEEQSMPAEVKLSGWQPEHYHRAAELIYLSYTGHIDAQVNDQYCSLHGSLRFLHNIVRFPGCGIFSPEASWVLQERATGTLIGLVLCSNVGDGVSHVTQLCISPKYRGCGLAERLMRHCVKHLIDTGSPAVTLTVTEANGSAMRLYERLGFVTRHRFDAMVYDTTRR